MRYLFTYVQSNLDTYSQKDYIKISVEFLVFLYNYYSTSFFLFPYDYT